MEHEFKIIAKGLILYCKINGKVYKGEEPEYLMKNKIFNLGKNKLIIDIGYNIEEEYLNKIQEGINYIINKPNNLFNEEFLIYINLLEFIDVDFQADALKIAIIEWLSKNMNFEAPKWTYSLDDNRKFHFSFLPSD